MYIGYFERYLIRLSIDCRGNSLIEIVNEDSIYLAALALIKKILLWT